jgi:phenylpyruvate tautomerase PptA (4-oxalocrotonate tautomerase family)
MPYINVKVSSSLNDEKIEQIKTRLGKAISLFPGKSEAYLMVNIEDNCNLYFKGNNSAPTSFTEVAILGSANKTDCENVTAEICNILEEIADVPPDRSYVKFEYSDKWGYNGFMF